VSSGFPEVRGADSLTLLVDGERLLDAGARHNLRNELTLILQAALTVLPLFRRPENGGAAAYGTTLEVPTGSTLLPCRPMQGPTQERCWRACTAARASELSRSARFDTDVDAVVTALGDSNGRG
jgi:hypothetical protein